MDTRERNELQDLTFRISPSSFFLKTLVKSLFLVNNVHETSWCRRMVTMKNSARSRTIDYDAYIQKALRQVVREILTDVAAHGLPGDHHFYITFATNHPWVELPAHLKEEYPDEMVIVLQHEFWDLEVKSDSFSVTLCFDDIDERITVPFMSLINFVDPSVKFGLQFVPFSGEEEGLGVEEPHKPAEAVERPPKPTSNVISLDDFRNK